MESQNYNLLEISNKNTFVGVSPSNHTDLVVITQQSQGIHVYSIFDQKCQRSWIVPPSISFGCEAVLDTDGNYYTVANQNKNNNTVWSWKEDVEDLIKNTNQVYKAKFAENIFQIVPSRVDTFVAIIQEYGSFQITTSDLRVLASHSGDQKGSLGTVCWADFAKDSNVLLLVLELETVYTLQAFDIVFDKVKGTSTLKQTTSTTFKGKANRPMVACTYEGQTQSFCVLWNDLTLDFFKITDLVQGQKATWPNPKITMNLDSFFAEKKNKTKGKKSQDAGVNQNMTATSLSNGLVLLCGPSKENPAQFALHVWECNFGTHIHTAYVSTSKSDSTPSFVKLSVSKQKNIVTVCFPQKAEVVSISGQAPTLANLIGKSTKQNSNAMIEKALLPAPANLIAELDKVYEGTQQDSVDWKLKPKIEIAAPQWKKYIAEVQDTKKTQKQVKGIWKEAVQSVQMMQKLPLLFVNALICRHLTDESFKLDARSILGVLIRNKMASGQSSYYSLVPSLIKRNAVELLMQCLKFVDDLSAFDIVSMIKYITTTGGVHVRNHFKQPDTEEGTNFAEQKFLNLVVSHVASHTFMQQAISRLSFPQVLKILTCVHNWLAQFAAEYDPAIDTKNLEIVDAENSATPTLTSTVSWASLLLDTNYVQIITNSEQLQPMIVNMWTAVETLMTEFRDAVDVGSMLLTLGEIMKKQKHKTVVYGISVLHLQEVPFKSRKAKKKAKDNVVEAAQ